MPEIGVCQGTAVCARKLWCRAWELDWNVDIEFTKVRTVNGHCENLLLGENPYVPSRTRTCSFQVNNARLSHSAISTTCDVIVRLWFVSQTDVLVIIIVTYGPRLPLLKPE